MRLKTIIKRSHSDIVDNVLFLLGLSYRKQFWKTLHSKNKTLSLRLFLPHVALNWIYYRRNGGKNLSQIEVTQHVFQATCFWRWVSQKNRLAGRHIYGEGFYRKSFLPWALKWTALLTQLNSTFCPAGLQTGSRIKAHTVCVMMAHARAACLTLTPGYWAAAESLKWNKPKAFRRHFRVCRLEVNNSLQQLWKTPFLTQLRVGRYCRALMEELLLPLLNAYPRCLFGFEPKKHAINLDVYPSQLGKERVSQWKKKQAVVGGGWVAAPQVHLLFIAFITKQLKLINNPLCYLHWPDQYPTSLTESIESFPSFFQKCVRGYFNSLQHAYQREKRLKLIFVSAAAKAPQWMAAHQPTHR